MWQLPWGPPCQTGCVGGVSGPRDLPQRPTPGHGQPGAGIAPGMTVLLRFPLRVTAFAHLSENEAQVRSAAGPGLPRPRPCRSQRSRAVLCKGTRGGDVATTVAQKLGPKGLILASAGEGNVTCKAGTVPPGHRCAGAARPHPGSRLLASELLLGPRALPSNMGCSEFLASAALIIPQSLCILNSDGHLALSSLGRWFECEACPAWVRDKFGLEAQPGPWMGQPSLLFVPKSALAWVSRFPQGF